MSVSQEIDNKINIVDLVSRYIPVKKAGVNYKALCPFHNEKTPSFVISPTKNIAYCFSCHTGGGPVKFLSEIEKIPYGEALQKLAKEAGVELKTDYYKENSENRGDLFDMHKLVADWYHSELFKEENSEKLKYLTSRGLSIETINKFKLGYSSDGRNLFYKLKEKGFEEKDIIDSGIFVSPFKDKFYSRITFPIYDYIGNVVGFTARVLDNSLPKYLNSPTTRIFDKSSILFGLHLAKSDITKKGYVVIVEGQMDVISLHQAGFNNVVAISGTALTQEQIKLLKRITKKIYLCLDNDSAGINATFASLENTINEDIDIKIVNLGKFKDPDELLKSGENFEEIIKKSQSVVEFYINSGGLKFDLTSIIGKKSLVKEIFKFLKKLTSRIEIDSYIREISKKLDLSIDILYEELKNTASPKKVIEEEIKSTKFSLFEEISGYLTLYNYFDLFLKNFAYNVDEITGDSSATMLKKTILHKEGIFEDSFSDVDKFKSIELWIEEENSTLNEQAIEKKFLDLVSRLSKNIFDKEKQKLEIEMKKDSKNTQILEKYMNLIKKGKEKGLIK